MYIIELRSDNSRKMTPAYLTKKGFCNFNKIQTGKYAFHYEIFVDEADLKKYIKLVKKYRYNYIYYDCKYERSVDYHDCFLKNTKPPYRCRYCNRKLTKESLTVDHLIPVDSAKKSKAVRKLLKKNGCDSVNDINNLVPACSSCNKRKSNLMGLWYIRGKLGVYRWYWYIVYAVRVIISLLIVCAVLYGIWKSATY